MSAQVTEKSVVEELVDFEITRKQLHYEAAQDRIHALQRDLAKEQEVARLIALELEELEGWKAGQR